MKVNPAIFADDALEVYLMYKRKTKGQAQPDNQSEQPGQPGQTKQRGLEGQQNHTRPLTNRTKVAGSAADIYGTVISRLKNPRSYVPGVATLGLTGMGVLSSIYGPPELFGPTQEEIANGARFNTNRALKAVVAANTVGRTAASLPEKSYDFGGSLLSKYKGTGSTKDVAISAAQLLPGLAAGGTIGASLARGEVPNINKAEENMDKAITGSSILSAGVMLHDLFN